jgi:MFS family permease
MRAPALLRENRDFRLLWLGESVSELGDTVTFVALPFVALVVLHATTFEVAALSAAETIFWPFVSLPIGVWVDRVSRRRVLLVADSGRALALVSIPIAAALGDLTLLQLYIVGMVSGVLTIFFSVAYPSYLPSVVTKDELVEGNSLLTGAEQVAHISGPALGGALVQALGAAYALLADVASFIISIVAVFAIHAEEPTPATERRAIRHEIAEGVRFLVHHTVLRAFILSAATSNAFAGGAQAITVLFLVRVVHVHAGVVGLLLSVGALGGLLGAVLARRLISFFGDARTMVLAAVVEALAAYLVPATAQGWRLALFCAGQAIASVAIVAFNVVGGSYRQEIVPARLMGRVMAANRMVTWGALPIGAFGAGALAANFGIRHALWILAAGLSLAPVSLLAAGMWRIRTLPRDTPETLDTPVPLDTAT